MSQGVLLWRLLKWSIFSVRMPLSISVSDLLFFFFSFFLSLHSSLNSSQDLHHALFITEVLCVASLPHAHLSVSVRCIAITLIKVNWVNDSSDRRRDVLCLVVTAVCAATLMLLRVLFKLYMLFICESVTNESCSSSKQQRKKKKKKRDKLPLTKH